MCFTKAFGVNAVLGYESSGYRRTVDTDVRRLREKMGSAADLARNRARDGISLRQGWAVKWGEGAIFLIALQLVS